MRHLAYFAAVLLMAAGCSVYKDYTRPTLPELDGLYGAEVTGLSAADTSSLADLGWREFFTDPLLQELIARALDQNPGLQIASQRVIEAEASLSAARLALLRAERSALRRLRAGLRDLSLRQLGGRSAWKPDECETQGVGGL